MAKKRHDPKQRQQWAARWHMSGLSGREFAKRHGLPTESIYRWGREFPKTRDTAVANGGSAFAEVRLTPRTDAAEPTIEVVLANGRRIRVLGEVELVQLRKVVEALES